MTDAEQVKKALTRKKPKAPKPKAADYLSTGSTLLNLAITGHPDRGFLRGCYYYVVGDSQSGKTFLTLTCMAEASINPAFADYRFIHDDAENGALMDFTRYFGPRMANRVEPPRKVDGNAVFSSRIEEFYHHLDDAFKVGKPFIYVMDSLDSLSSDQEQKKFQEMKTAARGPRNVKVKGEMMDGKAKSNSSNLRKQVNPLRHSGSIILIVGQTRDRIDALPFQDKKTRAGGRAPTFYATCELWSSVVGTIKRRVRGKDRVIGKWLRVKVKKNRIDGHECTVDVPIFRATGFDDVGGCINYLVEEGHWKRKKKEDGDGKAGGFVDGSTMIRAPEYEFEGKADALAQKIQAENLEADLRMLVHETWQEIEAACAVQRTSRYE